MHHNSIHAICSKSTYFGICVKELEIVVRKKECATINVFYKFIKKYIIDCLYI